MKAKYRKEKQTDSSVPLSILAMSILLVLSLDRGCSARPAGQARVSGVIATSQNRNMRWRWKLLAFLAQELSISIDFNVF